MTPQRLARAVLGVYLFVHFAMLLPYASELFGSGGMLARASVIPTYGHVPNPLFAASSAWVAPAMVAAACVLSALFALGARNRLAALALWAVWMWLYTRNPLIANPSLPFIGLILVAHAVLGDCEEELRGSRWLSAQGAVFVVLALAYSYSGWTKLASPSWLDASALRHVLENPLARPGMLRELMLATPAWVLASMSYAVLAFELLFAPLCIHPRVRMLASLAMIGMHVGIVALVDFADLSVGMLMAHVYTAPVWLARHAPNPVRRIAQPPR